MKKVTVHTRPTLRTTLPQHERSARTTRAKLTQVPRSLNRKKA